jgi:hypothetical protein
MVGDEQGRSAQCQCAQEQTVDIFNGCVLVLLLMERGQPDPRGTNVKAAAN